MEAEAETLAQEASAATEKAQELTAQDGSLKCTCAHTGIFSLTRETGSRFRRPPEAEIPKLLKTKLFARS